MTAVTAPTTTGTTATKDAAQSVDLNALAQTLDQLTAGFQTLSSFLLRAPDQEVLDQVRTQEMLQDWPGLPGPERTLGVGHLLESAALGETAKEVASDYNTLFVGPERTKAAPYESVHLSEEKLIFEQQTFAVRAAYAEFGLAAPKLNQEPDDHIGLELGFLAMLGQRALDCIADSSATSSVQSAERSPQELEQQVQELNKVLAAIFSFLDLHVLRWAPAFFTLVNEQAETEFFRGVGALGLGVLEDAARSFNL